MDNKKENQTESFIEIDPKGTIIEDLVKMGYKVERINIQDLDFKNISKFNPSKVLSDEELKFAKKYIDRFYLND
ncbi:hypothetical protein [Oceanobacillus timonensis]|uniref:hypothetical protein n=1 Tax=Oceanobacillus timonensis TaxID=1926285 RepID=UPI0009B96DB0|nr:hypothetical protein [Oceanobacillus timonensis]